MSEETSPKPRPPRFAGYVATVGPWQVRFVWPDMDVQGGPQTLIIEAAPDADPDEIAKGITPGVLAPSPSAR